jgi:hypothetical protein
MYSSSFFSGSYTATPGQALLPPDVYGIISRMLPAGSRASLFATCTAARDGVLSSCQAIQVTLVGSSEGLPQRAFLLQRARHKGMLKEQALITITLRLQVGWHTREAISV